MTESDVKPEGSGEGAPTRSAEGEVRIDAPPRRVWRALTEAAELERWFPLEAGVEPGEGGTIRMSWGGGIEGTAKILVWDPPHHLRTSWDWGAAVTDYHIEADGEGTYLRVVTSGFPMDAAWDDWVEGTVRGWAYELGSLKTYLEEHAGEDRAVVYLRRVVPLDHETIWTRLTGPEGLGDAWLGGEVIDDSPPRQRALLPERAPGAMLRLSVEPSHGSDGPAGSLEATLFLTAWGEARERLSGVEAEWSRLLDRLFPEGTDPTQAA